MPKVIVWIVSEFEESEGEGRLDMFGPDEAVVMIGSVLGVV
jgi:hypothetical protein